MTHPSPKVLLVTFEYGDVVVGGIGRVVNGLTQALRGRLAFNVFVFRALTPTPEVSALLFDQLGEVLDRYGRPVWDVIDEVVARQAIDIVHFLNPGYVAARMIDILKRANSPVKLVCSCHSLARDLADIYRLEAAEIELEAEVFARVDRIHLLSQTALRCLEQKYADVAPARRAVVIPNGIASERDRRDPRALKERREALRRDLQLGAGPVVLCVSRWCHGKGLEWLLAAVPDVVARHPDVRIVLAGRKAVSWENDVQSYVNRIDAIAASLAPSVVALGWINDFDREALMELADVYAMPSEGESFPYSILEPMIAGVAIVSSRLPCVQEMLEEGAECAMYDAQDVAQLGTRLSAMLDDRRGRENMARRAQARARTQFNWPKVAGLYIDFYRDVHASGN